MKLLVLSDLHTEMAPFEPAKTDADVVILAGDIGVRTRGVELAKRAFHRLPVIYVPGNHEYYGKAIPHLTEKLRAVAAGSNVPGSNVPGSNVHLLDEDAIVVEGVRFLGCTFWTGFDLFGADTALQAMEVARARMTDYARIRKSPRFSKLSPRDTLALHRRARAWLRDELAKPFDGPTVVVTHHAPSRRSLPPEYADTLLAAAYASDADELVAHAPVALWVHGHTHHAVDYEIGGTRVVCNPRGYPDEPVTEFRPDLVVEV